MKKLLIAFIALSLLSCSDDDSSSTPTVEKNLDQMVVTHYPDGLAAPSYKQVYDFDDHNRVMQILHYSPQNELSSKRTYEYNQMLLSVTKTYDYGMSIGDPSQPSSVLSFSYDGSLRIIVVYSYVETGIEGVHSITSFTYNADNTISAEKTTSAPPEEDVVADYTYYKNADGRITKVVDADGAVVTQAVYSGNNMDSYTITGFTSKSYLFNSTVSPKGQYLNINLNKYDKSFNNTIIAEGFEAVSNGLSKYISQQTSSNDANSVVTTYTYEFDEDGYPIKVSLFKEGSTQPYEVREITYM